MLILLEILLSFYIVRDMVTAIDRTFVFKDDLIASARKTLWSVGRMHKKRKIMRRINQNTESKDNYISLNIKDDPNRCKPSTHKKKLHAKEDKLIFVGIHSRLVFQLQQSDF